VYATPLIPDRIKHGAALIATAVLPPQLRVRARYRLLSRLQLAKARRADVLLILHPKCGGTWLRVMLYRLYQLRFGIRSRRVFSTDELHRFDPRLPLFLPTNGHYSYQGAVARAFEDPALAPDFRRKKVVLMARHPCDIAVSWHLQFNKRTKAYKRELMNHSFRNPVERGSLTLWEFVQHPEIGLPALIDYFNDWDRRLQDAEHALLVRYEDLRARPVEALKRIAEHLDGGFSDDDIEQAVAFGAFDNLRALEKANYFTNPGLRMRKHDDPDTWKVRRGKVGGYRDYFTPAQAAWMETQVETRLSPRYGYGGTDARAEPGAGRRRAG
jgi:Sulfotransferase domain